MGHEAAFDLHKIPAWEREFEENKKKEEVSKGKEKVSRDRDKGMGKERKEAVQTATARTHGESVGEKAPTSA